MTPAPVLTKRDFVARYKAGEFGNASPSWDSVAEFVASGYDGGPVHLRNRVKGGPTWYDVPPGRVGRQFEQIVTSGLAKGSDIYVSAMAPTPRTLMQGEVMQTPDGLSFYGTYVRKPMRDALATDAWTVYGITAVARLRWAMCPKSYDWLQVLLDRYPDHVVEFSSYGVQWGTLPGFNTVFWEVRRY